VPQGRELVTIKTDVELPKPIAQITDELALVPEDLELLKELFQKAGFRTWLREIQARLSGEEPAEELASRLEPGSTAAKFPKTTETQCVLDQKTLDQWFARIKKADLVAFDTETTSLNPMQAELVGFSVAIEVGKACYVPLAHNYPDAPEQLDRDKVLKQFKPWLEDAKAKKVGQNLKYDMHVLENYGIRLAGIEHDTLLESYVLEAHRPHDMDSLAKRHLERKTITYTDVAGKGAKQIGFDQVALEQAAPYAAEDADVTLQLHQILGAAIDKDKKLGPVYQDIEMKAMPVLQRIERNGVLIDPQALAAQSDDLGKRVLQIQETAYEAAGQPFNIGSPKQLGEILFNVLKLPVKKKTASGAPSTDEGVLTKLAEDYPLPKIVLEYRSLSKLKSTYTDTLPKMVDPRTGRVHTNYSQATAVTGRLASTDPNLQNIPVRTAEGRRIREAFVAPKGGHIVSCDYSQIELRIMAHISEDAGLLKAFKNGEDVHRATASEVFSVPLDEVDSEQRRYAKVINFGLIYGMSAYGLAGNLNIGVKDAKSYIDRYFTRYPGVSEYMAQTRANAKELGYVETVFGRRLWLPEIRSPNGPRRQGSERAAINAPMQGTAADLIKMAMVQTQDWLEKENLKTLIIMQVHDELVLEVPDQELELIKTEVPRIMGGVAELSVPLLVEAGVGTNWEEAH